MRRIFLAGLASMVAMSGLALTSAPAAALTPEEVVWCVSAFSRNPKPSACMAAIHAFRCANRDNTYEREAQISACTEASESANWTSWDLAELFINRGTAYQVDDHRDEAIADYSQAIRLDPHAAVAFYDRGQVYHDKGDLDRAIADYSEAIRLDAGFSSAYADRGDAYRLQGEFDLAIADYSEAIRRGRRGDAAFHAFESYYGRATAYRATGKFDDAVADYSEALRIGEDDRVFLGRALTYLAKGDLERALADLNKTTAEDDYQEDPRPYTYRGILHLYSFGTREALSSFYEAWGNSDDPYVALWLDITRARDHRPSRLAKHAKALATDKWPGPIVRLYLGETTEDAVFAAADDPDPGVKAARLCEANFFAGALAVTHGVNDAAERLLRNATAPGCTLIIAWAANAELKALGAAPSNELIGRTVGDPNDNDAFSRLPIMKYPPPLPAATASRRPPARTQSL
jgi:tetratricopeptide (TPR) repeat protein